MAGALDNALDVFEHSGCHTMVLSNENAFWRSREFNRDLLPRRLFDHEFEFVATPGATITTIPSLFKQRVKAKRISGQPSRASWRASCETRGRSEHVKRLMDLFGGRVIVRSYDAASRAIIPDFLRTLGVPDSFHADNKDAVSTQGTRRSRTF